MALTAGRARISDMARRVDPRYFTNLIDANVLDCTGTAEDAAVDEILELAAGNRIALLLPYSVKDEVSHPRTPAEVKRRALTLPFTEPVTLTEPERRLYREVLEIVQGDAKPGKHDLDAFHIVESAKYGGYFLTNDKRLLRKRAAIGAVAQIEIVTPSEFLNRFKGFEAQDR